jgi:cytochrome c nitrite reductase small subunit
MMTNRRMLLAIAIMLGIAIGVGAFTFVYARGASYLTNDPAACANCHIMREHYGAWMKSSHRSVAVCNDCHAPHDLIGKYATKARNGFWHSYYFTTGDFPYPLRITEGNHEVTEGACRYCHESMTESIDHGLVATAAGAEPVDGGTGPEPLLCTRCHRHVGHLVR